MRDKRLSPIIFVILILVVLLGVSSIFLIDVQPSMEEPKTFEDTIIMGVSPEAEISDTESNISIPKAQAYYTEYRYVIGYHSIQRLIAHQQRRGHRQQFGQLAGLYVTDYSSTSLQLSSDGYPQVTTPPGWVDGTKAVFVVDSTARTHMDNPVLPFSERRDANDYVDEYGGSILNWSELQNQEFVVTDAQRVRRQIDKKQETADGLTDDLMDLKDRPESTVVGQNGETIQEAINHAPENSTIIIPNGTYNEHIVINKSVTVAGSGNTTIRGQENGTVFTITERQTVVTELRITGVGDAIRAETGEIQHALSMAYGGGDSAITIKDAPRSLVDNVTIETPASGVILRNSSEAVIREISVEGSEDWQEGYMGILMFSSEQCIVEKSKLQEGRDGIYAEHSHGLIFRNNSLRENRIGVHLMYTSHAIIANTRINGATHTGIHDMTNSQYNSFRNNIIRSSPKGLRTEGWYSYVAGNIIANNHIGMTTEAGNSIYEGNLLINNAIGMQGSHILPTNKVTNNDFIKNAKHATARRGPLRLWNRNYWEGAIGHTDGAILDRPYSPTGPVDSRLHRVRGTPTLAFAPVQLARDYYQSSFAGLRSSSIIDTAPRSEPANPDLRNRSV